jgi:glucose-6-phosphate isomerase
VFNDTEPAAVRAAQAQPDFVKTLFIVASKSGTAPETLSLYHDFRDAYAAQETPDIDGHFIAITDPGTPLAEEAYHRGFRYCFENPSDVGERYSALSYVGLLPMACIGVNIDTVLAHAHRMQLSCGALIPTEANPGARLGALLGAAARSGRGKVTLVIAEPLRAFGAWVEQLLAGQADKSGQGLIPVVEEELEAPDGYGDDRLFVKIDYSDSQDAATMQRLAALQDAGHPVVRMTLPTPLHLGAEFFRWEFAIATAGVVLGLNPFDEPKE